MKSMTVTQQYNDYTRDRYNVATAVWNICHILLSNDFYLNHFKIYQCQFRYSESCMIWINLNMNAHHTHWLSNAAALSYLYAGFGIFAGIVLPYEKSLMQNACVTFSKSIINISWSKKGRDCFQTEILDEDNLWF